MEISVQLYSVREALAADPAATIARLAAMGFTAVEPFGLMEHAEVLRPLLREHDLRAPSTHASLLGAEDPEAVLRTAAAMGITTIIEPYHDREAWQEESDIAATAERLNELAGIAAIHGVRVGYHNHDAETRPHADGRCGLEILANRLDPRVVLELDTFWCAVGGTDPAALLGTLGQRVQLVHLKDGPLTTTTKDQLPLGEGAMDAPAILSAAPWLEVGVIEFDDYDGDVLQAVERSRKNLVDMIRDGRD